MNEENNNQTENQPNSEPVNSANFTPSISSSSSNRIIQPSDGFKQELEAQKQQESTQPPEPTPNVSPDTKTVFAYPDTIKPIDNNQLSPSQQSALALTKMQSEEDAKPVSLRVKPLLAVAVVTILASIYSVIETQSMTDLGSIGVVATIISLVQLGMSVYLLVGKDHNTVAFILKIYLVFQLFSLISSIINPIALMINGVIVVFLYYVFSRVNSLSY